MNESLSLKNIAVEQDVFDCLLNHVAASGQNISAVLRAKLDMLAAPPNLQNAPVSDLDHILASGEFKYAKGVVGRFLTLLGWLYKRHAKDFSQVEAVRGRGRIYFARTAEALEESGTNVNPKPIPGSPYWVISTSPTDLKQETLGLVMKIFGYTLADIKRAQTAIAPPPNISAIL